MHVLKRVAMSDSNDDAVDRPSYGEGFAARIG
jgi:hypothetical protein